MKIVVFGLTLSSSWGNGHATLWRGLCRALHAMGHRVVFYERDAPFHAAQRDLIEPPYCELVLYREFTSVAERARADVADAQAAIVTSYCADALAATALIVSASGALRVFYDLDTPVTLERVDSGESVAYVGPRGYAEFDLVLSITGGASLETLASKLGAKRACALYGSVDPDVCFPAHLPLWACDLSYLGTYSPDRQAAVETLFLDPARRMPERSFILGGSMYPAEVGIPSNVRHVEHVPPPEHSVFYGSSALTLNVTRAAMAKVGFCPSGRLFEAAACGTPIVTDSWEGLDHFFEPEREILIVRSTDDVERALALSGSDRARIAAAARRRVLAHHTATTRAHELVALLERGAATTERRAAEPTTLGREA